MAALVAVAACGGSGSTPAPTRPAADVGSGQLQGAGATFPEPFYTKAFYAYNQKHSQVSVNYQAIGSGGGIQQFTKGTVDFGASDVPMNDKEIAAAGGDSTLVQFPSTLGVIAIAYNLPDVGKLRLDGPTLAGIYLGRIKRWDDPAIKALNGSAKLPAKDITVVHRSDGSGTTFAFTDYLSKLSTDWKSQVGNAKSVQWPTGVGASGNQGVGQQVKTTDYSIGYVELAYVVQAKLQQAELKNRAGKYIAASIEGATQAAAQAPKGSISATSFSITDEPGDTTYPITTFSWVILKKNQADAAKGKAVVNVWKWVVTDGQQYGKDLQYPPLPKEVTELAFATLKQVTSGGAAILI